MVRVKICGITNAQDAMDAIELGADALGFIFADSPRKIAVKDARPIIESLPPFISCVGLFVNEYVERVMEVCELCGIRNVQLHGDEPPEYLNDLTGHKIIKAFRVRDEGVLDTVKKYTADAILLDSFAADKMGGTGTVFPWDIARKIKEFGRIIIAGGLTPENIADAITTTQPYAVDIASGVEKTPGKKDKELMRKFIAIAKGLQY